MARKEKIRKNDGTDLAAERAVLAGICQYGSSAYLDIDFISEEFFSDAINQTIFSCLTSIVMAGDKVDVPSILSKANAMGMSSVLESEDEIAFIRSLFNLPIHKDSILTHAAKLAKLKIISDVKRTLDVCANRVMGLTGEEEVNDIVAIIEEPIVELATKIYDNSTARPQEIAGNIQDYINHLADNPCEMMGIPTGFPQFDLSIGGGLRRKCVDVVGARMKVGKTFFAEHVGLHVSSLGIPVLMLDTEMDREGHLNRMLANYSDVEINDIQTGKFGQDELKRARVVEAGNKLEKLPFKYMNVSGKSFESILSIARQWIYSSVGFDEEGKTKDCLIIYDYLKMMSASGINDSMKEYQALGFQITQLHNFCVKYDVPCLTFIQLNRDGIKNESTDVASGSDRILWLCTSFSIFKEKSIEEQADDVSAKVQPYNRKLVPIISRYGGGLDEGDYVNIRLRGEFGKLENGPTRNELKKNPKKDDAPTTDISTV